MGSSASCNDMGGSSSSSSSRSSSDDDRAANTSDDSIQSNVYIKDKFRLEFLDCHCCCDSSKTVANCDFQGVQHLQDLYEMV